MAWFKNAVIYSLDVETFYDSNGDGIGDFQGLISRLDYISGLGVTCIWLLPFYPSPNRDNGYDVMSYYGVDERLGTLGDFTEFMRRCHDNGIRVIIDMVINHTSREHPWFQEARRNRDSRYRDFYVWSDKPIRYQRQHLMFKGEEETVWTFDELAGQYYLHRFYKEQPDLNISNELLQDELLKIMGFWLQLGVSGFRLDAAEMLIEPYGMKGADQEQLEEFLSTIRRFVSARNGEAVLLAETNIKPELMKTYLRRSERMHMLFNFFENQNFFLSLATEDARPLRKALGKLPAVCEDQQWLNFLRHHDELSLRLLSEKEREKVFSVFAPEESMRIYETGIRRRLAPMLDKERRKLYLSYSLLFSLPGAVLLRYGDEIGMGDDLSLPGRTSVRTPMQWSMAENAGFTTADKPVHPVISRGTFAYQKINVLSQQRQDDSLLNWIERMITTRRQTPEIGEGITFVFDMADDALFVHACQWRGVTMLFLHNFSPRTIAVRRETLRLTHEKLFDIFSDSPLVDDGDSITVNPYGYNWIRIENHHTPWQ